MSSYRLEIIKGAPGRGFQGSILETTADNTVIVATEAGFKTEPEVYTWYEKQLKLKPWESKT